MDEVWEVFIVLASTPRISVIMPAYNAEPYVTHAIKSILQQTFRNFEFIVINDGSTDRTADLIAAFNDQRIRLICNDRNLGLVVVRNLGMSLAIGEYVALMDADDVAFPDRLLKQFMFMENNPDFAMVGANMEMIDESGRLISAIKYPAPPEKIPSMLFFGNYFTQSSIMIRRNCLPSVPYRNFPGVEDYDLWLRIAARGKVWNLQETLVQYRIHKAGISMRNEAEIENYLRIIVCRNLEAFGIVPTEEELFIQRKVDRCEGDNSLDFITEAENWLLKLIDINDDHAVFDVDQFRKVVGEKWFYSCLAARKFGLDAWMIFGNSKLRKFIRLNIYQYFGFLVSCLANQFIAKVRSYA